MGEETFRWEKKHSDGRRNIEMGEETLRWEKKHSDATYIMLDVIIVDVITVGAIILIELESFCHRFQPGSYMNIIYS